MLKIVVDNLQHPDMAIRRISIEAVQQLNILTEKAIEGLVMCLANGSEELQQDALDALSNLIGVKDKKGLKNLFVKMNILSPSPTPESKMPVLRGIQLISREDMLSSKLKISKEKLEKSNYIKKWLSTSLDDINGDDSQSLQRESRISSFRNLNPIQSQTRVSVVNLTLHKSSTHSISSLHDLRGGDMLPRLDDKLKYRPPSRMSGCNLLSRLGFDALDVYDMRATRMGSRAEERPSFVLRGSSFVKIAVSDDQDESEQVGQSKTLKSMRQADGNTSKRNQTNQEKVVLPRIIDGVKTSISSTTRIAVKQKSHDRVKDEKTQDVLKLPDIEQRSVHWRSTSRGKVHKFMKYDSKVKGIDDRSSQNARHHFEATLNNERRKSLLRGLQQRRIERQLLLENLQETPERFLVSTASSLSRDKTAEFRLIPKIKIRCTKRVGTSERKRAKLGDAWRRDKTFDEVSSDTSEEATSISINDRLCASHSQALTSVLEEPRMITMDKDFKLIYPPKALRLNITRFLLHQMRFLRETMT
ncbi:uncharacterized protein LOC124439561 [Xenia sp. Carnegie-2017]|uniref:uncharacterized protein LOC124439561 n=1 Tax=Xenia sp. Carnegie-2017 TaxID=2897299 RepID=UPI001F03F5EA|nr:uncharacterized protein LOC124439561 [Xenia sp. Carnegie-2017]